MNADELARVLHKRCRLCYQPPGNPCIQAGGADRPDEYRATHPHHLRMLDAAKGTKTWPFLAFVGTQTMIVRTPTKTQATEIVIQRYAQRGYRIRKAEIKVRRATADDVGWLIDQGEPRLAAELEAASK